MSSNVVHQYAWFARASGSLGRRVRLAFDLPRLGLLEMKSRRRFNLAFFRHYAGLERDWLVESAAGLSKELLVPHLYPGAVPLLERTRREGFGTVLVTGSLDFAIAPLARMLEFDQVIANKLVFSGGVATGELEPPVLAESEKVRAMKAVIAEHKVQAAHCRAYSDSYSDLPMLEAVGNPTAVNAGSRLRRLAESRNWAVMSLK